MTNLFLLILIFKFLVCYTVILSLLLLKLFCFSIFFFSVFSYTNSGQLILTVSFLRFPSNFTDLDSVVLILRSLIIGMVPTYVTVNYENGQTGD